MRGRGLVRIAHPEVDDVLTGSPGLLLEVPDNIENVWRQALDTPKLIVHNKSNSTARRPTAPRQKGETVLSQPRTVNAGLGTFDGILTLIPAWSSVRPLSGSR